MAGRSRRPNGSPTIPTRSFRIPDDLWNACKTKADREGRTMADVVITLLTEHYVRRGGR